MNSDEFYEYEDRAYTSPTLSSGEQEAFIDNLRNIQGQNNAQIAEQTYNLGTQVPSNLGGLGGGEAYFASRYQTPQVGEMVSTLKTAAQAQALNDVMNNYQAQLKQRYNQAYRSAQKRQREKQNNYYNSPVGGGGGGDTPENGNGLEFNTNGSKSGGFWDTILGKATNDWIGKVMEGGAKVNVNTTGETANADKYNVPMSLKAITAGGSSNLGVWPNGVRMTEGSTYNYGGHTYGIERNSRNEFDIIRIK